MQESSLATHRRAPRVTFAADPELRTHVTDLIHRAYFNLHGTPMTIADGQWQAAIIATAMQLCLDVRVQSLSTRELIRIFEGLIRVSEEHTNESKRHAAMANNVFYLKETALDMLASGPLLPPHSNVSTIVFKRAHRGSINYPANDENAA